MLTADDKWAIGETLALHGHLFDEGELDRLDELFTDDVVYDVSALGSDVRQILPRRTPLGGRTAD